MLLFQVLLFLAFIYVFHSLVIPFLFVLSFLFFQFLFVLPFLFLCVFDLDFSCKFSKLQYNNLAFVAGLKRATDEGSLPETAQYSPYYLP